DDDRRAEPPALEEGEVLLVDRGPLQELMGYHLMNLGATRANHVRYADLGIPFRRELAEPLACRCELLRIRVSDDHVKALRELLLAEVDGTPICKRRTGG